MCFEVAGTLLGILVYTLYYILLANKTTPDCTESVKEPNTGVRHAYQYHALTLGVLIVVFIVITFLGVKEQKGEREGEGREGERGDGGRGEGGREGKRGEILDCI